MTRVALLTPPGRGGIALVELAGDERILAKVFARPLPATGALALGVLADASGPIDEVLVARVAADRFEIGCHGGPAVARRALAALEAAGATVGEPFASEESSAIQAEARTLLPLATTDLAAKVLLAGLSGDLERKLAALPLDAATLAALVASARLGIACWKAPVVALVGAPNAGKSTLFNALLGRERALVSSVPGTTRDALEETCALAGVPVRLVDLAGLRESADEVERAGVELSAARAAEADLRVLVLDASETLSSLPSMQRATLVVLNKRDLLNAEARANVRHRLARDLPEGVATVEVSARTGTGIEAVRAAIVRELVGEIGATGGSTAVTVPIDRPVLFTERQRHHASRALEALRGGREADARAHLDQTKGGTWPDVS